MSLSNASAQRIQDSLYERFGEQLEVPPECAGISALGSIASRRVHRKYSDREVDARTLRLLCACALSSPSKSDLQQRDIVIVTAPASRLAIAELMPDAPWVGAAPVFLVFCGNAARIGQIAALRDKPFPNNHLDLFFNAIGDTAIALATFVNAAESMGLGCCPISEIRNHAEAIDDLLQLPPQVFPFAGLCVGWPATTAQISPRLPLDLTVHENTYGHAELQPALAAYDQRRQALQPYQRHQHEEQWGEATDYGWSEDKARQYSTPQRTDFGAYIRGKGFSLD